MVLLSQTNAWNLLTNFRSKIWLSHRPPGRRSSRRGRRSSFVTRATGMTRSSSPGGGPRWVFFFFWRTTRFDKILSYLVKLLGNIDFQTLKIYILLLKPCYSFYVTHLSPTCWIFNDTLFTVLLTRLSVNRLGFSWLVRVGYDYPALRLYNLVSGSLILRIFIVCSWIKPLDSNNSYNSNMTKKK